MGRGRRPGTGGVSKRGFFKGIFRFYGAVQYAENTNLLLIYGQNPEATVVKSYDYWKKEHRSPKSGVHGYTYMVSTEYEKDGEMRTAMPSVKDLTSARCLGNRWRNVHSVPWKN